MKRRHLIIAGVLSFVLALLTHAPIATLYGWGVPGSPPPVVGMSALSGTLLSGQAGAVTLRGRPALTDLQWTMQPLSLLWGRASFRIESRDPQLLFDARVGSGLGGTRIRDLKLNGSLRALLAAAGQPFVPVEGQVGLDLALLKLASGWPRNVDGTLRLMNLSWTLARDPLSLGDFQAELTRDEDDLTALITSLSGPLDLNGDSRLRPDRSYELHLQLKPKPEAAPMVLNLVRSLGPADAQGYHHIRRQGQFPAGTAAATPP